MEKFIPRLPPIVKNQFKAQQSMLSLKFEYSIFIYHYSKKIAQIVEEKYWKRPMIAWRQPHTARADPFICNSIKTIPTHARYSHSHKQCSDLHNDCELRSCATAFPKERGEKKNRSNTQLSEPSQYSLPICIWNATTMDGYRTVEVGVRQKNQPS